MQLPKKTNNEWKREELKILNGPISEQRIWYQKETEALQAKERRNLEALAQRCEALQHFGVRNHFRNPKGSHTRATRTSTSPALPENPKGPLKTRLSVVAPPEGAPSHRLTETVGANYWRSSQPADYLLNGGKYQSALRGDMLLPLLP